MAHQEKAAFAVRGTVVSPQADRTLSIREDSLLGVFHPFWPSLRPVSAENKLSSAKSSASAATSSVLSPPSPRRPSSGFMTFAARARLSSKLARTDGCCRGSSTRTVRYLSRDAGSLAEVLVFRADLPETVHAPQYIQAGLALDKPLMEWVSQSDAKPGNLEVHGSEGVRGRILTVLSRSSSTTPSRRKQA